MDFPSKSMLAGLSEPEYEALAALDDVVGDLAHEWEAARASSNRLMTMMDAAERRLDNGTVALSLHFDALDEATNAAMALVSRLECLLWRYTAAYAATGLSMLDRLAAGRPPLTPAELEILRAEPSVGRLQELLEVPAEHRYGARVAASGPGELERYREQRTQLLRSVESVYFNLTVDDRPWTRATVAAGCLSEMDDGKHDEPWGNLVKPMLHLARQTPYEISVALDPVPAPDGPGRQVTSMRQIHTCPKPAVAVTAGYAPDPASASGERVEMTAQVCADHDPAPDTWFSGLVPRQDPGARPFSKTCGLALDYRQPDRVLRAHADLWITPLTGEDFDSHSGWPQFLRAAAGQVEAAHASEDSEDWNSVALLLDQAAQLTKEGNPGGAAASLGVAETMAAASLLAADPPSGSA